MRVDFSLEGGGRWSAERLAEGEGHSYGDVAGQRWEHHVDPGKVKTCSEGSGMVGLAGGERLCRGVPGDESC